MENIRIPNDDKRLNEIRKPVKRDFNQPVERDFNQSAESDFNQPVERDFNQPVEADFNQPAEADFNQPVEADFNLDVNLIHLGIKGFFPSGLYLILCLFIFLKPMIYMTSHVSAITPKFSCKLNNETRLPVGSSHLV